MFYSNNDNYMQDLYFYNQSPNNTYMTGMPNNNMMGNFPNTQMMNGMNNMSSMQNPNQNMMNCMCNGNPNMYGNNMGQNINNLYPSTYRIIAPVVSKVVANSNCQFFNEDSLNNMVDTVYNIVEGQIDYDDSPSIQTENTQSTQNTNSSSSSTNSSTTRTSETRQVTNSQSQTSNSRSNRNDSLLRDIIKILILKELLSRNAFQTQQSSQFNYPQYYNQQPYNMNF